MTKPPGEFSSLLSASRTRVEFGPGMIRRLGACARTEGAARVLLVTDPGIVAAGHADRAAASMREAGLTVCVFDGVAENPTTVHVDAGVRFASETGIDFIVGLGGGSSMDCAKGINFILTNGGRMSDYRGYGKATKPMLPMIAIPTTAGTGSEAQSYALISTTDSHIKMACGDPKAAFRVAILDPALTVSQPRSITAISGFDAIAHAVETYVTTKRNPVSEIFSREAWRLLEPNYERVLDQPDDLEARGAMQLGAFYAGVAIENSMLGATHACANPLTAHYGTAHGAAIAMLLPSVVRWNERAAGKRYESLYVGTEALARRLEQLAEAGGLRVSLGSSGVAKDELPALAAEAAEQWTGTFNPRPFDQKGALEVYEWAY